ncbi:MAG: ATP-binding cassette domain-containing protein [Sulfitobacter sp.]
MNHAAVTASTRLMGPEPNVIAGYHKPSQGQVQLDGEDITGCSPNELFGKGLLRTFQIAHEFSTLTVRENLMVVPADQAGETYFDAWFRPGRIRNQERALRAKADEVLDFLEIMHVADELAGNLSGGQKKLLELGRTMMVDPRIVFLDEVGAGVNRTLLNSIITAVRRLNVEKGYTFCLIEHDMNFVSELCDHVFCMAEGSLLAQGSVEDILKNEEVIDAYLGRARANKKVSPA